MQPTTAHAMSFADYHAIPAWGSSALKAMRRGPPARVQWEQARVHTDTDATILGSAVHCRILTPDLFDEEYAIKPEGMNFSTKDGKAWRDDPARAGRTILSWDAGQAMNAIVDALCSKVAVFESVHRATARETSIIWECPVTGEKCKGRPDWIEGDWIYDLKVSRYASSGYLSQRAFSDGWMHQSAYYRTGARICGMPLKGGRLVVVDPAPPHFVYTLEIKPDALDLLEIENTQTLRRLRECRESGVWPGTEERWIPIEPPAGAPMETSDDE